MIVVAAVVVAVVVLEVYIFVRGMQYGKRHSTQCMSQAIAQPVVTQQVITPQAAVLSTWYRRSHSSTIRCCNSNSGRFQGRKYGGEHSPRLVPGMLEIVWVCCRSVCGYRGM